MSNITVRYNKKATPRKKTKVTVSIPKELGDVTRITALFNKEGEDPSVVQELHLTKEEELQNVYTANVRLPHVAKYFFFFVIVINGLEMSIKISRQTGEPFVTMDESPYWCIIVFNDYDLPDWALSKLVYQIMVDRFRKSENYKESELKQDRQRRKWEDEVDWRRNHHGAFHNNDFFGGDLNGITEKLEYLSGLGVKILYLSPINDSPDEYHRYATIDHFEIDPEVGTFEDLENLCKKAHSLGIHVILDVAFNHCSSKNPIYLDALNNPSSIYKDWFKRDANGNICFWYGFGNMPELNQHSKDYQDYVYGPNGVIVKYSKYVDGFRLDLAESLEWFFLEGIRNRANAQKAAFIVGEWWQDAPMEILGKGIDAPTCYPLTNAIHKYLVYGESNTLADKLEDLVDKYPQLTLDSLLCSLSTHDIIRAMTIIAKRQYMRNGYMDIWKVDEPPTQWHGNNSFDTDGFRQFEYNNDKLSPEEYEYAKSLLKVGVVLQYFCLGNPCVFYGDEAGLYGWKDPFNRKCYPWGNEDKELIEFYQEIGRFRDKCHLVDCNPQVLYKDFDLFVFKRENVQNSIFVAVNRGENTRTIEIPEEFKNGEVFVLNGDANNYSSGEMKGKSGIVIKCNVGETNLASP